MPMNTRNAMLGCLSGARIIVFGILFLLVSAPCIWGNPAETYLKKGKDYYGLFQYQQARESLDKAVSLDQSCAEAHFYLGLSLRKLNQLEKAAQSLECAAKLAPDDADCRKALGSIYIQFAKDQKQACNRERMIDYLHKACTAHPQNTPVWLTLFELWSSEHRWQAIADAAQTLKQGNQAALESGDDEKLQQALVLAVKACIELRDHPKARDFLTQAGRIKAPNEELVKLKSQLAQQSTQVATDLFGEGRTAFNNGNYKSAIELLGKAQSSEPNNSGIANLINEAQKRLAIQDFTKSADDAEKQGNWEAALEQVNKAIEFSDGDSQLSERAASLAACIERKLESDAKAKVAAIARKHAQLTQNQKLTTMLKAAEESEKKRAYDAALISYQQALEMAKGDPDILAAVERTRAAAAKSKAHLDQYKTRFSEALRKLDDDEPDEAFAIFKELSEDSLNPQGELLPHLLKTSVQMQRWNEAAVYLEKLSKTASDSDRIEYYTGLLAFQRGEYAAAKVPLSAVQKRNPGFAPDIGSMLWKIWFEKYKWGIYFTLFLILFKLIRPILAFLSSIKEARTDAAIDSALSNGRYDKAIPLLEARLADDGYAKSRKQLMISLADAYLRQGRPADAVAQAAEVTAKDSKNPTAQRILGEASFKLGDHSVEGLERILNLYRLDENRRDVLSFLATQFKATRQESKTALELLTRQIQVAPDDNETVFYLADLYEKRQNFSAATLKVFERATRIAPDKSKYIVCAISCLLQSGKQDEAMKLADKAIEKWPDDQDLKRLRAGVSPAEPREALAAAPRSQENAVSAPLAGDQTPCPHCGKGNPPREYYCGFCGKPIR